jgi:hypothetical protein
MDFSYLFSNEKSGGPGLRCMDRRGAAQVHRGSLSSGERGERGGEGRGPLHPFIRAEGAPRRGGRGGKGQR